MPRGAQEVGRVSVGGVYFADAAGRAAAPGAGFEWSGSRDGGGAVGRVPPVRETMFGGYIDDFVVANKSAMDAYAAKEPMKTEDGHASFQRVAETRVGKVLQPYNPVTRIIGHGILDLPMIGKYVRAGTYLPVTYHHGSGQGGAKGRVSWYEAPGLRPGALPGPQGLRARARADEGRRPGARRDGVRRALRLPHAVQFVFFFFLDGLTRPRRATRRRLTCFGA